jgi:plastocyanin
MKGPYLRFALPLLLATGLAIGGCGKSSSSSPTMPVAGGADVTLQILGMNGANSYSPNPGMATAGQTVAWHNNDSITHTATADNGSFNTGNIGPGGTSAPIRMPTAGSFGYHCAIHPTMTGTLTVAAAPVPPPGGGY